MLKSRGTLQSVTLQSLEPRAGGVWSLASPRPEMDLVLAGTVARPTTALRMEGFVGSATVPTKKMARSL